jgi:hypothetical protein
MSVLGKRALWTIFLVLCAVSLGEAVYMQLALPDRVAIHFDLHGKPNGWATKPGMLIGIAVELALFWAIFVGAGFVKHLPNAAINLPGKEYWLAPGRRDATLKFLRDWTRWLALLTFGFVTAISGMVVQANLAASPRLPALWFWLFLVAFLSGVTAMTVMLFWRFRVGRATAL